MSRDDATILDILNACRRVGDFLSGLDRDAFLQDRKTQSAVLHQMLLIGEATKRLSTEFRARHPQKPWKASTGPLCGSQVCATD